MSVPSASPLGVCLFPPPAPNRARTVLYPEALLEILGHAGVCHASFPVEELPERLPKLRLLFTVGEGTFSEEARGQLSRWVEAGGAWISIGGLFGAGDLLGVEPEAPSYASWGDGTGVLGEGYLFPEAPKHPVLRHLRLPPHFFNGLPVRARGGRALASVRDAHGRSTPRAALVETEVGEGRCLLVAPDLTGAVVRIRQGIAVTRDGVPAPDGTAPLSDGVLKTGDGSVLDWHLDRLPVPGIEGLSAFLEPIADAWCELLVRAILHLASETGTALPILWYYPRHLPALGHLSHDTDGHEPGKARRLLQTLNDLQVRSTWCTLLPGYPADLLREIKQAGHELAMHYDAMSEGRAFSEAAFDDQWRQLVTLFEGEPPVTNKNHYLRWEGDTEFLDWCGSRGIQIDQSKGASKTGEAGYNFGTCHPYLSFAPDGRRIDVLELPTPTQDLNVFAPEALFSPLLDSTLRHYGILHLLFHPAHIDKPGVAEALATSVRRGKEAGLEWWTSAQINDWERGRRELRWVSYRRTEEGERFVFRTGRPLEEATILCLCPSGWILKGEGKEPVETVNRWGFGFQGFTLDLEGDREYAFTLSDGGEAGARAG